MAVADLAARAHFPNARVLPVGYRFPSRRVCHCYSSLYEIVGASDNLQPACDLANQDLYRSEKAVYCCQLFEVQCSKQYRMHEKPNTHRSNVFCKHKPTNRAEQSFPFLLFSEAHRG